METEARTGCADNGTRKSARILIDLAIRFAGVAGLIASVLLFAWLYRLIQAAPHADPPFGDYLLAAAAFLASSAGSAILVLGHHVNDRIDLAERWRRLV